MKDEVYKSVPRIKPHDEEEDFDWRKEKIDDDIDTEMYIVYNNPNWPKEIRERLRMKYGFKWILDHWERKEHIDEDTMHEMIVDGIEIEK